MEETIALDSIQAIAASFGASFDAEKIVETALEKDGTQYYKVRWVKYSWEPAASFTHLEHLIRDFWSQFGGIPDGVQGVTNKHGTNTKDLTQITEESTTGPGENNIATTSISTSILTQVSAIDDENVTNVQEESHIHISGSNTTQQLSSTAETVGVSTISPVQQIPLCNQRLDKQSTSQVELSSDSPTTKGGTKKSRRDEPKKRRKIPGMCSICGKLFKSTTNIAAHKKLHTEERQYECNECGRKFRRKLHLVRHKESHAGIKSYVCNICGSFFSSKWYMQAHAVIHTGDKPYKCDICQKCFNNKANLNKHKLIHENNRPFKCNDCGRTYRQSYDLKRHMSTHSVVKNFSCTYCDRSFAMKSYLQRHLLTTHIGDKKFSCEICSAKFAQLGHLNYHIKQQHGKSGVHMDNNESSSKENEVDDITEKSCNKSNEIVTEENEFFSAHNNSGSIVFLSANEHGATPQVISSKQIYQETFNNPQHNLSIAVNNSIAQKCLIIEANKLVGKHSVILGGDENQICLENADEHNEICLVNEDENEVEASTVTIRHNLEEEQRGEYMSQTPVQLQRIQQSDQDVSLSVLTSDHTENYFTEQEVLEMQKDIYM